MGQFVKHGPTENEGQNVSLKIVLVKKKKNQAIYIQLIAKINFLWSKHAKKPI